MKPCRGWGVAALAALVAGSGVPASADLAEIKARGSLRVLVSADELPHMFSFESSGDPGLEREMVLGFARTEGVTVEVVKVDKFERIIPALLAGEGDVILGIIDTPARREQIAFTAQTLPARHVAGNRSPAPRIDTVEQLRRLRVGSVMGSSWTAAALEEGVKQSDIVEYDGTESMLAGLKAGSVEAVVMSVTDLAQAQRGDAALQSGVFVGTPSSAAWGVRKEDKELRRALSRYIDTLVRSPSWGQLVLKYFSADAVRMMSEGRR